MLIAVPVGLMIAMFLTELCPQWLRRPIGTAIELLAGIPSIIYGIWGLFVFAPFLQETLQPFLIAVFGEIPVLSSLFAGPPYGIGMLTAGLILAIMVLPFITSISRDVFDAVPPVLKEAAYGLGCTTWEVVRYVVLPYTRVGVIGGVMLGLGRALGETMAVTFVIGNAHRISASVLAPGTTISATIANEFTEAVGDLYTSSLIALGLILFVITFIVLAAARFMLMRIEQADRLIHGQAPSTPPAAARIRITMVLSLAATAFGLGWLVLILGVLLWEGFSGLSLAVFTEMTPPPGSTGGLLNAIMGSLVLTVAGRADRHADRHPGRHLHGRVWPPRPPDLGGALHQRHPAQRAVHRHRPLHLRGHGRSDGAFLRLGRRGRARGDRHPGGRAHHRGHADAGAGHAARGSGLDRPAALADDHAHRLPRRARPAW